eukprot:UN11776
MAKWEVHAYLSGINTIFGLEMPENYGIEWRPSTLP